MILVKRDLMRKKEELSQSNRKRLCEYKKAKEEIKKIGDDMYTHGKRKSV